VSTQVGARAEAVAARYLQDLGMKILARNWRNRWCEIDLIALDRDQTVRIVEVKYRQNSLYGSGFDYINAAKSDRLRRAATAWVSQFLPSNHFQIDIVSIAGDLDQPLINYLPSAVGER
jgi:putative endonuclease